MLKDFVIPQTYMSHVSMIKPAISFLFHLNLQGKEDFERQQKELLDKENIIKQNQVQLGQEQVSLIFLLVI